MAQDRRSVAFDADLQVESYCFRGVLQKFPNHFHEYYVIGFIESGRRALVCKGLSCTVGPGDLLLFNPRDNHACAAVDEERLDYSFLNIQPDVMARLAGDIAGIPLPPVFAGPVVPGSDIIPGLRELHAMIMEGERALRKQEAFYFLMAQLLAAYTDFRRPPEPEPAHPAVQVVCDYVGEHYADNITLDELGALAGLSKYHLLRRFTRQMGISPYSYLETIRIGHARRLLEEGVPLAETAQRAGFADQSHFTRFFKRLTGITPGQYRAIFLGDEVR